MFDVIKGAWRSLRRKGIRTVLTMSGIVIGVSLVSLVTVIGSAGKTTVNRELENMGLGGLSITASGNATLETESLNSLRTMEGVASAVPLMLDTSSTVGADGTSHTLMLCGIDSGEVQAIGISRCYGRLLSAGDIASCARVCVVDEAVAQTLFATENVVGRSLETAVDGVEETFRIVGVTKAGSMLLQNVAQYIPGMVYIPYSTMQQLSGRTDFDQFAVKLREGTDEAVQIPLIEERLARVSGETEFVAQNLSAQRDQLSGLMDIVTLVLTVISGVSLLVAGLSIMTVMMVSVGERTREIGIKKALGATNGRILREFLTESLLLSLCGGLLGVIIGGGLGSVGLSLFGWEPPSLLSLLPLALFAAVIGIIFGVYPALKAARLDPVDALRCE